MTGARAFFCAGLLLLQAPAAHAVEGVLLLNLQSPLDERPGRVCVLYKNNAKAKNGLELNAKLLAALATPVGTPAAGQVEGEWEIRRTIAGVSPLDEPLRRALAELAAPPQRTAINEALCGEAQERCRPRFRLAVAAGYSIYCSPSPSTTSRVLLVRLDVHNETGKPRWVQWVELAGSFVVLHLSRALGKDDRYTAQVIGGHYLPGRDGINAGNQILLELSPRCYTRELRIPAAAGLGANTCVDLHYSRGEDSKVRCVRTWSRNLVLQLPHDEPIGRSLWIGLDRLHEGAATRQACLDAIDQKPRRTDRLASFQAEWSSPVPPRDLRPLAHGIRFRWESDCAYPRHRRVCPTAAVAGKRCPPGEWRKHPTERASPGQGKPEPDQPRDYCSYLCEVPELFSLPATVSFSTAEQGDIWNDQLRSVEQSLTSYVQGDSRHVAVDFSRWAAGKTAGGATAALQVLTSVRGNAINVVEVVSPSGRAYQIKPEKAEQFVSIPGATCGTRLRYRIVGDLRFEEKTVDLVDGVLRIAHPRDSQYRFALGLGAAAGVISTLGPYGTFGASELRAKHFPERPYASVRATVRYQPTPGRHMPHFVEAQLSYLLSQQPFVAVRDPTASVRDPSIETSLYSRVLFTLLPLLPVRPWGLPIEVGLTPASIGFGFPLLQRDESVLGLQVFWAPHAALRLRVSRALLLEASLRGIYPDRTHAYHLDSVVGAPARTSFNPFALAADVGFHVLFL